MYGSRKFILRELENEDMIMEIEVKNRGVIFFSDKGRGHKKSVVARSNLTPREPIEINS